MTERIVIQKREGNATAEINKVLAEKCAGAAHRFETQSQATSNGKPVSTRVVVCGKDGMAGDQLTQLQKARERLSTSTDITPENRVKILSALDESIAKLKAGQ